MPTITGWVSSGLFFAAALFSLFIYFFFGAMASAIVSGVIIAAKLLLLSALFFSVIWKGVGSNRSLGDIILVSAIGILFTPIQFSFIFLDRGIYWASDGVRIESLMDSVYFSVVTWTTLGYGDILPSPQAQIFVIIEVLLSPIIMALFIASIVRAIQSRSS